MRLKNAGDIIVAVHELGHHFDRQMGMWSKSTGLASGIPGELIKLGRDLYGDKRPEGGYRAEGFAEFIGQYLIGADIRQRAPKLYDWFTTEYLPARPAEAKKLRELEGVIAAFQLQTPQQAVDALLSPRREDWSGSRIAASLAGFEAAHIDAFLPILRGMQATGADLSRLPPSRNPFMLAIYFARSAGGRALSSLLSHSVDLYGRENGESLRSVFSGVVEAGKIQEFTRYWVAKRVQTRYHEHGLAAGLSIEDANAIVAEHDRDPLFRETAKRATEWAHRQLHLLVEAGVITRAEFDKIEAMNPIYMPMMRQFVETEKKTGRKGHGKGLHRVKGGQQPILDPIAALAMQAEKFQKVAMQAAVMRSLVEFYDGHKNKSESMGKFMSEIPAPKESVSFTLANIRKDLEAVIGRYEEGQAVIEKLEQEEAVWGRLLTVYRPKKDYSGGLNVMGIEINGERRFFEVRPDLLPILEGVTSTRFMDRNAFNSLVRGATSLQRLGATGLNPGFGLLRNPIRDTLTASITGDYHFHVPMLSTMMGSFLDIVDSDYAKMYHGAGLDIAGFSGQDLRHARSAGKRVLEKTPARLARSFFTINGIRELLSHSEVGPRLMEFRAAHKYALDHGMSEADAMVLAGAAAKDVTVNFSRAGTTGRKMNEVVLFYNAAVQSIDKMLRSLGAKEAMPWAKNVAAGQGQAEARLKSAAMAMGKGLLWVTLASIINYFRNREKEWWKELPAHEKWGYIHIGGMENDGWIARIPLPFELGALFGSLPVAFLENSRTPGAFREAWESFIDGASPIDIGYGSKTAEERFHAILRNVALLGPIADLLKNEDWKGSKIVPQYLENRLVKDQKTPGTSTFGEFLGQFEPMGLSPVQIDHLLNTYTSGIYRRIAAIIDTGMDPSGIDPSNPSTLPVMGTMFLRPGTSKVTSGFYDRMDQLRRLRGSKEASLEEIGELREAEGLSRKISGLWSDRRAAQASDRPRGEREAEIQAILGEVQSMIRAHNEAKADYRQIGAGAVLYAATAPSAGSEHADEARRLLEGVAVAEQHAALRAEVRRRGGQTLTRGANGMLTDYGRRVARLRGLEIE
jgi:hypothetical protein